MQTALVIIAGAVAFIALAFYWTNRPVTIRVRAALPKEFPENGFSHAVFESLLERYVDDDGNVKYEAWHGNRDDIRALRSYLAAVARFSPEATPDRFETKAGEMAYWMYGYNAYVIYGVLDNWPIGSITDVKAPIEAVKGLGFFYRNRYVFGGNALSLYTVENRIIRKRYEDPRIHFVLNCGSAGCPAVRPDLPDGEELEERLREAARDFINDPENVYVDHEQQVIELSEIFKWYRNDFLNELRAEGRPASRGLVAYLCRYADNGLRRELEAARNYDIRFREFDWSLNRSAA